MASEQIPSDRAIKAMTAVLKTIDDAAAFAGRRRLFKNTDKIIEVGAIIIDDEMAAPAPAPSQSAEEWAENFAKTPHHPSNSPDPFVIITTAELAALLTEYAESVKPKVHDGANDAAEALWKDFNVRRLMCEHLSFEKNNDEAIICNIALAMAEYADACVAASKPPVPESAKEIIATIIGIYHPDWDEFHSDLAIKDGAELVTAYAAAQTEKMAELLEEVSIAASSVDDEVWDSDSGKWIPALDFLRNKIAAARAALKESEG